MKKYKYIALSFVLSTQLFALPEEGQLIVPNQNNDINQQNMNNNVNQNNYSNNEVRNNKNNSSDDIIKVLDEANKKRLEFEEMKSQQKEKDKQNDKDYVLEQMKKDNEIYDESIKKRTNDERLKLKEKDIKDLDKSDIEQYHDSIKTKIATLQKMEKDFVSEIKVDGVFSLKIFGDTKKIIVPTSTLTEAIEKLMIQKQDRNEVGDQIEFYKTALKSTNKDYLKEIKNYESLHSKKEFSSLKANTSDTIKTELSDGDMVYKDIYITNISKNSYTLILK